MSIFRQGGDVLLIEQRHFHTSRATITRGFVSLYFYVQKYKILLNSSLVLGTNDVKLLFRIFRTSSYLIWVFGITLAVINFYEFFLSSLLAILDEPHRAYTVVTFRQGIDVKWIKTFSHVLGNILKYVRGFASLYFYVLYNCWTTHWLSGQTKLRLL